jgi:hypothetical protein
LKQQTTLHRYPPLPKIAFTILFPFINMLAPPSDLLFEARGGQNANGSLFSPLPQYCIIGAG